MTKFQSFRGKAFQAGLCASAAVLPLLSTTAYAQAADAEAMAQANAQHDGAEGEIIVTARKRNESMVDVPVAISALSAKDVQRYAVADLTQVGQVVPQVIIARSSGAGSGASFIIRGVGSSQGDTGIEQTVTLNLDGIQLSRGRAVGQSFFDVQQLEVLKGPQALFFGKNSPGGVISIRSAGPTKSLEGYLRTGYEFQTDERYVEAAISGPINDAFGYRVAVRGSGFDGYVRNAAKAGTSPLFPNDPLPAPDRRQPGGEEYLGRITLQYDAGSDFRSTLRLFGATKTENALALAETIGCTDKPKTLGIVDPTGDCKLDGVRSVAAMPASLATDFARSGGGQPYAKNRFVLASWNNELDLGDHVTVTAVTGYYNYRFTAFDEFSYSSIGGLWTSFLEKYHSFSQELRVATKYDGPVNIVVGGLFEDSKRHNEVVNLQLNRPADPANGRRYISSSQIENRGRTYSLFGQATWNILENLELAGGVRWTRETKSTDMVNDYVHPTANAVNPLNRRAQGLVLSSDFTDENWSPEATLSWHPIRRTTLYVAYKTGYKSGGFSTPQGGVPGTWDSTTPAFGSETAKGFELGAKAELMGNRLRLNAALYDYRFSDLQQTSFNAATFLYSIRNAASARTRGFEVDANFVLSDAVTLRASAAHNDARYGTFKLSPCWSGQTAAQGCIGGIQDLSGTALARAPRWNLAAGTTIELPVGDQLKVGLTGDVTHSTGYWMQETQNPSSWQKAFTRIDASLRFGDIDDVWTLALIGRNLTNRWIGVASTDKPLGAVGEVSVSTARPREVMLQASYRF
ncbi:TonB-dependent receptor [Novosphingobium sp. KCTC 2891]|uniref:TonB-dependent receptor n=1 Tax=Novosphingobium sp. KCTC 2891 TaxID=2989730 RepID=UPI0022227CA4|nr:TonB-dependent receptor [Novosphingobium sp. KCTC 2891]MCW1384920.1 TonB-dependent receptor [Novosphingobium sp. KCTC 2891]